ncbi:EF-hand domain-containing protein [Sphingomonas adhaesiva]|uniref:EF-hand domain-containing protein n=1 Tax=Sphingomonas adhaesiva TaxID=28212 RepID=UPI002FF995D7
MKMLLPLVVAALSVAAVPALAQETRGSATQKLDAEFAASDTDHDGFLSPAEIEARMRKMKLGGGRTLDATHARRVAALFLARADTDKDGRVSKAESAALMGQVFSAYDLNRDGKVDAAELAKARAAGKAAAGAK